MRSLAIGRKNWLFVGNKIGGKSIAAILTLVPSCRAIGINPQECLEDVMSCLMGHISDKIYGLLPDQLLVAICQK